ncbi:MAG TPA: aminoacetone oxidase family FAD-binding enzyme [Anaerolineaceae bacterium]|nr:aminoacetone oxidase family FAD-binding enzyme [Anaerolineaceae bacterium]HQC21358.1 aminoacetone oxidase family FAD-binding enzyme [Anaerolineaceae bacterium]
MEIAVIGAGASGIFAALAAARPGNRVTLYDHNAEIGKKLLVTGSSRCNISNALVGAESYTCADEGWIRVFFQAYPPERLRNLLNTLGIPIYNTADGWYYPLSNSAQSVVEILKADLHAVGVELALSTQVVDLRRAEGGFALRFPSGEPARERFFDKVVLAAGGKAYPALGSRGELFPCLSRLGHSVVPLVPALGPLSLSLGKFQALQGLRFDVGTAVYAGSQRLGSSFGNVIFTAKGLNGPGVMNISHLAARQGAENLRLELDFSEAFGSAFSESALKHIGSTDPQNFLNRFFSPKASRFFLEYAGYGKEKAQWDKSAAQRLTAALRHVSLPILGTRSFDESQLSAGGVPVSEVRPDTCESTRVPGLYLVGETLDVVGPCGGYNLHFAFTSGTLAGSHLAELAGGL